MIPSNKQYIFLKPETRSDLVTEFGSCLSQITHILKNAGLNLDSVLKQTIFINAKNNDDYRKGRDRLKAKLREFYDTVPPTSIVSQPPEERRQCAMEPILFDEELGDSRLEIKSVYGVPYSVINYTDTKEVYAAGITVGSESYDTSRSSKGAFDLMEQILRVEGLTFGDVVRQWNYIEGIIDQPIKDHARPRNYQVFNEVRSLYYSEADFEHGYPAATGIGMTAGGVILEFIAVKDARSVDVVPIRNPKQVDAHRYSDKVLAHRSTDEVSPGISPKFERAKFAHIHRMGHIYVSGTAAIRGEESVSGQNVKGQTKTTIENMIELISRANLLNHGIELNAHPIRLSYLRAYVKEEKDVGLVREVCEEYLSGVPCAYLISDICRDDLLVELEGIAE